MLIGGKMAVYDRLAAGYDKLFVPLEKRFLGAWRKEVFSELPKHTSVLELGCGTGLNFSHYHPDSRAIALELSHQMLLQADKRKTFMQLVEGDAEELPFGENEFDAAFATLVFCSIPDPIRAFNEVKRIVRPGGRIVLIEHVRPEGILGRVFDFLSIFTVALIDDHFNRRTAVLAEKSGLKIIEIRRKWRGIINLILCENTK